MKILLKDTYRYNSFLKKNNLLLLLLLVVVVVVVVVVVISLHSSNNEKIISYIKMYCYFFIVAIEVINKLFIFNLSMFTHQDTMYTVHVLGRIRLS